jgi:hypothetical protein
MEDRCLKMCLILLGLILFFTACRERTSPTIEVTQVPASIETKAVPSPSLTPAVTQLTATSTPTQTKTEVVEVEKITTTQTSVPKLPVPRATLTDLGKEQFIREALLTNLGCELPCWWGLTPGVAEWSEVEVFFRSRGFRVSDNPSENNGGLLYGIGVPDFEEPRVLHRFGLTEKDNKLNSIILTISGYKSPAGFQEIWQMYSPKQIMNLYGPPSRVWFFTRAQSLGTSHGYDLYMTYEQNGFMIRYDGYLEENNDTFLVCPRFENGLDIKAMEIYLQAIDNPMPLEQIGYLGNPDDMRGSKRIKTAAGIDENEFYELFMQTQQPACFETPRSIWE